MTNYTDYDYIVEETFFRAIDHNGNEFDANLYRARMLFIDYQHCQGELKEDYWDYSDNPY